MNGQKARLLQSDRDPETPVKILHVATTRSDRASGVSIYVHELLKALAREGSFRVGLLPVLPGVDPLGRDAIPGCVTLPPPPRPKRLPWGADPAWPERIRLGFGRPDFVHFHGVYDPFQASLARLLRREG